MNSLARGGQIGAIAWKDKEVVKLFDWFCLRHETFDADKSGVLGRVNKLIPIQMKQSIIQEHLKEGTKIEYFKVCPRCYRSVKEGEYVRDE